MIRKYLEEINSEYRKLCGSYAKILSYISKIKESKYLNDEDKNEFEETKQKFKRKIEYMNNFLKKNMND